MAKRTADEGEKGSQADKDDTGKQVPYESGEDDLPPVLSFPPNTLIRLLNREISIKGDENSVSDMEGGERRFYPTWAAIRSSRNETSQAIFSLALMPRTRKH